MRAARRYAPGERSLQVIETQTRDAIKDGNRTIAYIAIGGEAWGPLLAAAPELKARLSETTKALQALYRDVIRQKDFSSHVAAEYGRIIRDAFHLLERDL